MWKWRGNLLKQIFQLGTIYIFQVEIEAIGEWELNCFIAMLIDDNSSLTMLGFQYLASRFKFFTDLNNLPVLFGLRVLSNK